MKVIAENIGKDTDYLTAGKEYEVVGTTDSPDVISIIDNEGERIDIRINGCAHISGRTWTQVDSTE